MILLSLALACAVNPPAPAPPPGTTDSLRRVAVGDVVPDFKLPTLDGAPLGRDDLRGRAVILVFLSAQQRRSELAAREAHNLCRTLHRNDLALVFATADTDELGAFRKARATTGITEPLLLDADRSLYGDLGLIVLPTTIVIDPQWHLAHVISSHRADYETMLQAYAEHAVGAIDDDTLTARLSASGFHPDPTEQKIAQLRASAAILRQRGMTAEAERELRAALELEPAHLDAQLDLAALLIGDGRFDEAGSIMEAVLATHPGQRRARLLQGIVFYHTGRLDEAEAVLNEMLVFNADPAVTHYYLGLVYEARKDSARAMEHYKASLERLLAEHPL